MDLYCKRCGEPWDFYGVMHGDLTDEERERFSKGEGCPACFGKPWRRNPSGQNWRPLWRTSWKMIWTASPRKWKTLNICWEKSSWK